LIHWGEKSLGCFYLSAFPFRDFDIQARCKHADFELLMIFGFLGFSSQSFAVRRYRHIFSISLFSPLSDCGRQVSDLALAALSARKLRIQARAFPLPVGYILIGCFPGFVFFIWRHTQSNRVTG
jgi:hypothetical protein